VTAFPPSAITKLRIEQALDSMTEAFVMLDRDFRIAYVNPAAAHADGRPAETLIGLSHWEAWPVSVGTQVERRYRLALLNGESQHFQHHYIDRSSSPPRDLWLDIHAYPGEHGLAIYYRDISRQTTERAEYLRIERAYKAALSNTPDLIYVFDLNHRFIYANEALLAMWGRTWEDAIGKNCLELGYPDWHAAMHDREIEEVVATKRPIRGEVHFTGTHGRRLYEYIFVPVFGTDGEVESIAGTTRDNTERKQAEQALLQTEKLAAAGRLAASISHEINNPLEAITNLLFLVELDQSLKPETRGYLATAQSELEHVSQIATQTLRFYRQSTRPTSSTVRDVIESVIGLYNRRIRNACVQLDAQYRTTRPVTIYAGELRQVVANLLGNSLDALGKGGCIVIRERRVRDCRSGRPGIQVFVSDTGPGIAKDLLSRIFDAFFSTKADTGTGLGLWASREIVQKQGGRIRVRSREQGPYRGTLFSVFLPEIAE